ncbi:hypothetical protein QRZ34_27900 [Klebsiella michiganensis]|uniref:hypothetical protein n=1 Tax=Klebsiella michiganensis TaxID=1134687 RepID=UPI002570EB1C|nr:hypothetical protein [Klebsiella michiganensis]MDL4454844.1 hypothetical protein [Klebsiella michiganensis]
MSKALFADLAEQFLSVAVKTWVIRSELPAAAAADVLLTTAIQQGFLEDRGRPLLGNTLNEWGKNKKYPRWAIQSAMALLWADGWRPITHPEWAAYAAIHVQSKKGDRSPNSSMCCRKGWTLMWRQVGSARRRKTLPDIMRGKSCDDVF